MNIRIDDEDFVVSEESWPSMEAFLGLGEMYKPERYRPNRAA